ncbi:MAG: hypothetical protein ACRD1K_19520, partial [Acidimicrobiales bacterium]
MPVMPRMGESDGRTRIEAMLHRWRRRGVAFHKGKGQSGGELPAVADRALYRARAEGSPPPGGGS